MKTRWTKADIAKKGLKIYEPVKNVPRVTVSLRNAEELTKSIDNIEATVILKEAAPPKNKYGNVKEDGYDSKHEKKFHKQLKLRQSAGELTAISRQVRFKLSVCTYVADYVYLDLKTKTWVVIDCKGVRTCDYIIKYKMMFKELGITILEV